MVYVGKLRPIWLLLQLVGRIWKVHVFPRSHKKVCLCLFFEFCGRTLIFFYPSLSWQISLHLNVVKFLGWNFMRFSFHKLLILNEPWRWEVCFVDTHKPRTIFLFLFPFILCLMCRTCIFRLNLLTETGSEDDGLLDPSDDDFFLNGSSSDDADADDEWTDKSTRYWESFLFYFFKTWHSLCWMCKGFASLLVTQSVTYIEVEVGLKSQEFEVFSVFEGP